MSVQENTDLVRRYFDTIWNKGQFEREPEFVALDIVVHAPPIPGIPDGIAGPLTIVAPFAGPCLDLHLTQDLVFGAEGQGRASVDNAFHTGRDLFGFPASGKEMVLTGINIFRIANGRIAERWGTMDLMGLMQQLGVAPATPDDLLDLRKGWYM